ncbi:unnamed protein product [Allacma fusca]|uniref:Uncharacterized protein n=1 Tax=Allacma fusca TaxID=39272 RepID=A0A8J2KF17_9HEXA|nr:unnamed protein product [Allacma fusca]
MEGHSHKTTLTKAARAYRASNRSSKLMSERKLYYEDGEGSNQPRDNNRDMWGTWNKPYDFTLTVIGYVMGIHNFWRFPYLCYKFGGAFFIPFVIILIFVGIPLVFMEFTVGQYLSVGPTEACAQLAPILTGVSYLMAWNAMMTCILYAMMMSWSRFYTSVSTSCNKVWESCNKDHYYNTPECFTGEEDDQCEDIGYNTSAWSYRHEDKIYYNYTCIPAKHFCDMFGAQYVPISKMCVFNGSQVSFSIYERRTNAPSEHFYGGICGLQRLKEVMKKMGKYDPADPSDYQEGLELVKNEESHSGINMKLYSLTTWLLLAIFLYEGLLSVSGVTYIFTACPFILLIIFTSKALSLSSAITGIEELTLNRNLLQDILDVNMWAEAGIQVIGTMGIGTGVLITLATFNKYHQKYLFDAFFTSFIILVISVCASLICFCTIGQYLSYYRINIPFSEYLHSESRSSSIEFGYIVYTHFLTLIHEQEYAAILFFFMLTSFSTDSALRLVQMALDTVVAILPLLRRRRFTALLGICGLGFIGTFFLTQNGGIINFLEFEYFTISFVNPLVALIEVASFSWIYGADKIAKMAEEMKIVSSKLFRWYLIFGLKFLSPLLLMYVLVVKYATHTRYRFNNIPSSWYTELFFWLYSSIPVLILILKITVQVFQAKKPKCRKLFYPPTEDKTTSNVTLGGGGQGMDVGQSPIFETDKKISPMLVKAVEKWKRNADRFDLIPNAPVRKHTPTPDNYGDEYKGLKFSTRRRKVSSGTTITIPSQMKDSSMQGIDDEVIAMDYAQGERWKRFLWYVLSYFEQWPGRFDEDSYDDSDGQESVSGNDSNDNRRRSLGPSPR